MFYFTMSALLCACLILLGLTSTAFAFQCYACQSILEPGCQDLQDPFVPQVVACFENQQCFHGVVGVGLFERGCYLPGRCNNLPDCHVCDTERCNSATNLKAFALLGMAATYLLYLL